MARPAEPTPIITTTLDRRVIYSLIAMIVGLFLGVGLSIGYSAQAVNSAKTTAFKNQQQICGIIVILDNAYQTTPPTTPLGRKLADAMHAYREFLGCDSLSK